MAYDNNVPLVTQTIAQTTGPIHDNFAFIQTDLQVDHIFNGNTPFGAQAEGTHVRAAMSDYNPEPSGALPTGVNGIYYSRAGQPKFYDGATNFFLQTGAREDTIVTGTTNIPSTGTFTNIFTPPANSVATFWVYHLNAGIPPNVDAFAMGQFITGGNALEIVSTTNSSSVVTGASALTFQLKTNKTGNYIWFYQLWTP